ncbi:MAG: hypothetical protein ACYTAN_17780 [Planctomycetota bacterium]|jgi:TolA-binding protein
MMMTKIGRASLLVLMVAVWVKPALALAGDGGSPDGSEYIQPGAFTAAIFYLLHKLNQVAKPLKQLADNGDLSITTKGFKEQQAELDAKLREAQAEHEKEVAALHAECDGLRSEVEKLRAAQEAAAELEDLRRQREADAARLAATQAELAVAAAKVEAYEALVEFEKRIHGEKDHDSEPDA